MKFNRNYIETMYDAFVNNFNLFGTHQQPKHELSNIFFISAMNYYYFLVYVHCIWQTMLFILNRNFVETFKLLTLEQNDAI